MAGCVKSGVCIFLLFCNVYCTRAEEAKEELVGSESKDGKLEIIKQIKKVNEDGSYTIGYEADDGSFKIESRDVLGNIKGTYGYVDETGEIKRVSYSTNNNKSEAVPKPNSPSVVQRIPRTNRTSSSTTKKPYTVHSDSTTQSTPTTTTVIQTIPKRRVSTSTPAMSTTEASKIGDFIKAAAEAAKTTTARSPSIIYATPASARMTQYQPKPVIIKSTIATQTDVQKSEGQLVRPEIITNNPTDLPLYRRVIFRNPVLDNEATNIKPVTEEPVIRGNLLRRQLSQEQNFDARKHIYNLQQSLGDDSTDVYSASVTTGTPRPLFTTTARSKPLTSTFSPLHNNRPSIRYPVYQRSVVRDVPQVSNQIAQESATTEPTILENKYSTPTPVVQIPANRQNSEPLIAIRHPFHGGTILVPVSQLQGRDVHPESSHVTHAPTRYIIADQQYLRETTQNQQRNHDPHNIPIYVRRIPPPLIRSIPVQVDENGYIRELPPEAIARIPYPVPVPVTPPPPPPSPQPKQPNNDPSTTDIDNIMPPVSIRDFQKLLEQLIIRQTRLERISELTNIRRHPELYQQNYQIYPQPATNPYYVPNQQENIPIRYIQAQPHQRQQYVSVQQTQTTAQQQHPQPVIVRPQPDNYNQEQYGPVTYPPQTDQYTPNRRVARLLNSRPPQQETEDDYLPPEVREMLLLRMLQLAINPALPLDVPDIETMITTPQPQIKKAVRNVQILGEEDDDATKTNSRNKRYWNYKKDLYK